MATKKTTPSKPTGRRGSAPGERRGGRSKGTPNKRTIVQQQLKEKEAEAKRTGNLLTPLEYMMSVVNDKKAPPRFRGDMAKNAAPYVHPKLIAITAKNTNKNLNVDAADVLADGKVDAAALYREIMGQDVDEDE